jgi:spore maturation protein CgeB
MKVIYVAQFSTSHDRDNIWLESFKRSGLEVIPFPIFDSYEKSLKGVTGKLYARFHFGSVMNALRSDLIRLVNRESPDWIHFRLPLHFDALTLMKLKSTGAILTCYYNDDPFSSKRVFGLHHLFIKSIPVYDAHFVFRKKNISEFLRNGAKYVEHCPPFYDQKTHNFGVIEDRQYRFDAVFIGHWENDSRMSYIELLVSAGYKVKVAGSIWDKAVKLSILKSIAPFTPVFGKEYSRIYRNAWAGLCFFSKINNDTWTRRPLEIIASGGLLVCERTDEAETFFRDRKEAYFFSSKSELLSIMKSIKKYPDQAEQVRKQGYSRLLSGVNSIDDRVVSIEKNVQRIRRNNEKIKH